MRLKTMPVEHSTKAASDEASQVDVVNQADDADDLVEQPSLSLHEEPDESDEDQADEDKTTEATADQATAREVDDEDLYWAEVQLAGQMVEVERERVRLEGEIEEAKSIVAACKENLKEEETVLGELRDDFTSETDKLLGLARKLLQVTHGKTLPTGASESVTDNPEDGWRIALTSELMQGVKGLSKKKLEALVDRAATAGDLEDLRGEASLQNKPYHQLMPKGIGAGVCDQIEERLLTHTRKWRQEITDPGRSKLAEDLVSELREIAVEWNADDCRPKETDDEHVHAGYSAFNEGRSHAEFISDDRTKSRQWMTGWVGAERLKQISA